MGELGVGAAQIMGRKAFHAEGAGPVQRQSARLDLEAPFFTVARFEQSTHG